MFEQLTGQISFLIVFIEGVLSFFSPCVLPLLPIYMGYLAGNGQVQGTAGAIVYQRKKVFWHTLCFILGISTAFFLLGLSFTTLGTFFYNYRTLFSRIGGLLIIALGCFQLGFFNTAFLQREHRIPLNLKNRSVNPLLAYVMGFTFSFAWTPCVGPALSSVLIMASGAKTAMTGNLLILVYAAGFVIPFLFLGLFTTKLLNLFKEKQHWIRYTIQLGGILLILVGFMTFTGWMNGVTSYLNQFGNDDSSISSEQTEQTSPPAEHPPEEKDTILPAIDFALTDQYGNTHRLSDYRGKVVFLNFWASWCGPCKREMPYIEEIYHEYGANEQDVVILGIANPKSEENPKAQDDDIPTLKAFLEEKNYTFPVLFDTTSEVFSSYQIQSFPTTFMIDTEGNIYGYVSGAMTKDIMKSIIEQTQNSTIKEQ